MAEGIAQPTGEQSEYPHYRAFISYRHAEVDSAVAEAVQHGLERFWVPKSARGEDGSVHIAPVFRDKEELPVSARLGDDIEAALHGADALVVICSPRTAESTWVAREIDTFLSCHDQDRVFVVLAEGEPYDVIPERLLYEIRTTVDEDGTTHEERVEKEPLACDYRDSSRSVRRTELIRLAAGILDVGFDSLVRRALHRRNRIIASIAAAITTVACGIAAYATWSNARIAESYRQTQINESEALADDAQDLLLAGDRMEAIQVALAALPESSTSGDRPFVPSAQIALQDSVQAYPNKSFWHSCYSVGDVDSTMAVSEDGLLACVMTDGNVLVSDLFTGRAISTIDVTSTFSDSDEPDFSKPAINLFFCPNGLVVTTWTRSIALFDPQTGEAKWEKELKNFSSDNIAASHDGKTIVVGCKESEEGVTVHLLDSATGETVETYNLPFGESSTDRANNYKVRLAFSPDDGSVAVTCADTIWKLDFESGQSTSALLVANDVYKLEYLEDVIVSIGSEGWAKNPLLGTAFYEAFSADLEPLWSKSETPPTYYDSVGIYHSNFAYVVGQYDDSRMGKQLIYVTGSNVKFVDQDTGEETRVIQKGSPVRACSFSDGILHTIDYEGAMATVFMSSVTDDSLLANALYEVTEGEYADFAVAKSGANANTYAFVWDATSSKIRVYCYRFRVDEDENGVSKTLKGLELDTYSTPSAVGETSSPLYFKDKENTLLCALDHESFEPLWTIKFEDLGLGDRVKYSPTSQGVVYLFSGRPVDGVTKILKMSSENAEVLDRYELDASEHGWYQITAVRSATIAGKEALEVHGDYGLRFYSCDTHELLLEIGPFDYIIDAFCVAHDAALLLHSERGREHCELFSLADGSELDGEVESLLVSDAEAAIRGVAFDMKKDLLVICCADGYLRCVDANDWNVRWEQRMPDARTAAFSPDSTTVITQNQSGACLLLSADTGEVLRSSSVELPLISSFMYLGDDDRTLYALARGLGLSRPESSIVKLSLDDDAFGPTAVVYAGTYYSLESNRLLLCDPLFGQWGVQPMYTLDELIDQAHEVIQGHELTDAERYQYRIAN